jgi:hypothetical protein
VAELLHHFETHEPRGELTIVLEGTGAPGAAPDRTAEAGEMAVSLLADGLTRRDVIEQLISRFGIPRNDAYRLVMELT